MVVWNSMLQENYYHTLGCCEATCSFHNKCKNIKSKPLNQLNTTVRLL